jgi:REP element-mobilizing transposase RayT
VVGGGKEIHMPRRARRDNESSFFHIIVQGIDKKYIFSSENYMKKYYELIIEKSLKHNINVLAYCIMGNHAHLLIYTTQIRDMSNFMRDVNTEYGTYYNKKEKRVGYVFRDRFVSEPICNTRYLYNCISYILLIFLLTYV